MLVFAVALVFNVPAELQRAIPDYTSSLQDKVVGVRARSRRSSTSAAWSTTRTGSCRTARNGAAGARKLRHRTGYQGHRRLAQHSGRRSGRPEVVARQGRSRRLLGVLVHQLPARHPARRRLVRQVQRPGPRGHRCAQPGVRVREGRGQRRQRRRGPRHHLPGRARQQPVDMDELPQPLLARRIPDRRERHCAPHQVRRGRLRRHRKPDQATARRREPRRRSCLRRATPPTQTPVPARRPKRISASARWSTTAAPTTTARAPPTSPTRRGLPTTVSPIAGAGRWTIQGATAESDDSTDRTEVQREERLHRRRRRGRRDGDRATARPRPCRSAAPPTSHQLVSGDAVARGELEVRLSKGLQAFSFTYG